LEPSKPKTSPALTESVSASTAVNAPKRRSGFNFENNVAHGMIPLDITALDTEKRMG